MPYQTVKHGLKAKKIKLPQMILFSQKTTNKILMYLLALSFCKILQKFLEPIQSYEDMPFLAPKWPICAEQFFFGYKPLLLLSCIYWPFFIVQNEKIFLQQMQSFWAQNGPIALNHFFFWKIINIILIYLLAPFIV